MVSTATIHFYYNLYTTLSFVISFLVCCCQGDQDEVTVDEEAAKEQENDISRVEQSKSDGQNKLSAKKDQKT